MPVQPGQCIIARYEWGEGGRGRGILDAEPPAIQGRTDALVLPEEHSLEQLCPLGHQPPEPCQNRRGQVNVGWAGKENWPLIHQVK
eukprot:scaffold98600_cov26-Prasinocladus_malaysianus.AAC.1